MKKLTKAKYPEKTSINLAMREEDQGNIKLQIGVFVVFLIALAAFSKFAVADPISEASAVESNYRDVQQQIDDMNASLKDYDAVQEEYSHYSNGYMNEEELLVVDRITVLNLLESCVMARADIQSLEMTGNTVMVVLSETNLGTVSQVVSALQADDRTSFVTVSTASTNSSQSNSQLVTANIVIELNVAGVTDAGTADTGAADAAEETAGGDAS
ncbi:hypothetical protein [Hespellia stercorisuis]|uniref:Tfp pilus assembly protein PilN n=1 Tax=Hespellia stercorisuis DSM 15480 TaxID=1121950 RepID=A0A1M6R2G8_9FIRM|nr:hypothetical protein [Hespellia stercorisuis]SHK26623.1 hypothetical protein SAMN02745243_02588 [Hespellia stercorisuis DSM 15480]